MIGTILLAGWILVIGLLVPMGLVDASALFYERAHGLATASLFGFIPLGQLVVAAILVLPLWKGAHHVRSLLIEFGCGERDGAVGSLLYLVAAIGSVMAIMAVVGLYREREFFHFFLRSSYGATSSRNRAIREK